MYQTTLLFLGLTMLMLTGKWKNSKKMYNKKGREHWKFLVIFLKEALKFQSSFIASISKSSPKSSLKKKKKKVLSKVSY